MLSNVANMLDFFLTSVADFLVTEPINYLFALVLGFFALKILKLLLSTKL